MWKKTIAGALAFALCASPALADRGHRGHRGDEQRGHERGHGKGRHEAVHRDAHVRPHFRQHVRPHEAAHRHHGYHDGYDDGRGDDHDSDSNDEALLWIGLAAVTVGVLSSLSVQQRALHQQSYWGAANGPIGQPVAWSDGGVSGTWTPVDEGTAPGGEYCREFQQEVRVGGRTERGYGTACWRPDGSWEIVN